VAVPVRMVDGTKQLGQPGGLGRVAASDFHLQELVVVMGVGREAAVELLWGAAVDRGVAAVALLFRGDCWMPMAFRWGQARQWQLR
jgi:hypothetical protein